MDAYSVSGRSIKHESDGDSSGSPALDRRATAVTAAEAENLIDMQQQIQQLLAASSAGVTSSNAALLSPLHFLQASGATTGASSLSIPWNMMPQYQMMFLAGQNASGEDGHVIVMPAASEGGTGKESGRSSASMTVAQQQQLFDAAQLQMVLQQQLNAAAAATSSEQALAAQLAQTAAAAGSVEQQVARQQMQQIQQQRQQQQQQLDAAKPSPPKPPKKPLTPYMMFSKAIWPQVKAANQHLSSVTEIGAIIGSLWRELGADEKLHYNEQFTRDKVRYEEELRAYLKTNGLHPSDLIKARTKKKDPPSRSQSFNLAAVNQNAAAASAHQSQSTSRAAATAAAASPSVQQLPGYQGDGQQRVAESLPNFSQAWAGQPVQQLLAQMGLAGQVYANSDGTISVDNANLASLLALQPQLLQQAQLFTDQQQGQQTAKQTSNKDSTLWQQGLGSSTLVQSNGTTSNGPASSDEGGQYSEYYTVNAQGQLVKHVGPAGVGNAGEYLLRIQQLETEVLHVQSALLEKTQENDRLKQELGEAFRLVTEYRQQQQSLAGGSPSGSAGTTSATSSASTSG